MTRIRVPFLTLTLTILSTGCAEAQIGSCTSSFNAFLNCRIRGLVQIDRVKRAKEAKRAVRDTDPSRGAQMNSAAANSDVLADNSSAPDAVGLTWNPGVFATRSRTPNSTEIGTSINLSTFSKAVALGPTCATGAPCDAGALFDTDARLRRFSINLGTSAPENDTTPAGQGSYTYGLKAIAFGTRDLGDRGSEKKWKSLAGLGNLPGDVSKVAGILSDYLFSAFGLTRQEGVSGGLFVRHRHDFPTRKAFNDAIEGTTLDLRGFLESLGPDDLSAIDQYLQSRPEVKELLTHDGVFQTSLQETADGIKHQAQFSLDFTSRITKSSSVGSNLYRGEGILSLYPFRDPKHKVLSELESTTNISYDFQDSQTLKPNRDIARFVEALKFPLRAQTKPADGAKQLPPKAAPSITISGEGDYGNHGTPIYKAGFKLSLPIIPGLDLPLSFIYANQAGGVRRADIKAQLGIAVDTGKMARVLVKP